MHCTYMKLFLIVLVIRMICASYIKYDELVKTRGVEWKRYFTPIYLSILLANTTAMIHWLMTGVVATRIYIDNFTTGKDNINNTGNFIKGHTNSTGDYRVAPLIGHMIGCTIYLPNASWIIYLILNRVWFYEVYSAIH